MSTSGTPRALPAVRRLVENSPAPMLVLDADANVLATSDGMVRLLGWSGDECRGLPFWKFVHPELRGEARAYWRGRIPGDSSNGPELRFVHKDGRELRVRSSVRPLDRAGRRLFLLEANAVADAAELPAVDDGLRWRIALESAQQGVWDHDMVTGERYYSPVWRTMRGLPPDFDVNSFTGEWYDKIHPDDRERVRDTVRRQNSGELREIAYDYRERHADGHWIWILARGRWTDWTADGRPRRIVGTDTDITDVKRFEDESRLLSRRLELALSTSRVGVWEADLRTGHLRWDRRMRELFGLPDTLDELPVDVWDRALHPDDAERARGVVDEALAHGTDFAQDYRIVLPDGEVRYIRCRAGHYTDQFGPKVIGVNWDVSADYVRAEELERANRRAEQQNADLEGARARMEYISLHDALTGLPNRRQLDLRLDALGDDAARAGRRIALLHVDLDRFKQINDTLGHAAGDAVLSSAAGVLKDAVGDRGLVARVGGDEFVILFEDAPDDGALARLANGIITRMLEPVIYQSHACRCGVSIGVAAASGPSADPRQLLIDADIALYRAKNAGRNRCCFFNAEMQVEVVTTKRCADEILTGLDRGEFFPVYQLQFDARTHAITGLEALARWRHPQRGVIAPDSFLKVAEDLNAVSRIDRLVLEQALADMAEWRRRGLGIPRVSVNVSALRLRDDDLVPSLRTLAIEPGTLSFELLESIFLDEQDDLVSWNIDQIRELGIGIDIDDFGTGHASIVGLLNLRPNRLKIDRQLVAPIVQSPQQRRLVASIVEIGKSQGIEVLAEGVETLEHARILAELGADMLQGYYFARPMPAADITALVERQEQRRTA